MLAAVVAATQGQNEEWHTVLWVVAVALVIYGVYQIVAVKNVALGIVLIVVGLLVGPGGVSLFL